MLRHAPFFLPTLVSVFLAGSPAVTCVTAEEKSNSVDEIKWVQWKDDIFTQAKAENRLVLLDLGAVWCHWCHVMDEITYGDADVARIIGKHFIAVRVDQDSRPDLSNRYEDYGWPATILFSSVGGEIAKRSGYIPPKPMASMLQAFVEDPTPGPSVQPEAGPVASEGTRLSNEQREQMERR